MFCKTCDQEIGENHRPYQKMNIPSVTTILSTINEGSIEGLLKWAANLAAEEAFINPEVELMAKPLAIKFCANAHIRDRAKSADRGSLVHHIVDHFSKGEEPEIITTEDIGGYIHAVYKWFGAYSPIVTQTEQIVVGTNGNSYEYIGTYDAKGQLAYNGEMVTCLWDYKTRGKPSKEVRVKELIQPCLYSLGFNAEIEGRKVVVDKDNLPDYVDFVGIVEFCADGNYRMSIAKTKDVIPLARNIISVYKRLNKLEYSDGGWR